MWSFINRAIKRPRYVKVTKHHQVCVLRPQLTSHNPLGHPEQPNQNESRWAGFIQNESRPAGFIFSNLWICARCVYMGPLRWIRPHVVVGSSNLARNWPLGPRFQIWADIQNLPKMAKFSNVFNGNHILGLGTYNLSINDYNWFFCEKCPNGSHLDKNMPKIDQNY